MKFHKVITITTAVAVLIIGGALGYYVWSRTTADNGSSTDEVATSTQGATPSSNPIAVQPSSTACIKSLYADDSTKYSFWKNAYQALHPEMEVYDAGSYCLLSDGTQLVSFSYHQGEGADVVAAQSIALFDSAGTLLRETNGLAEHTFGDLVAPTLDSISNGLVLFSFTSGDGGYQVVQRYEMDLKNFQFRKGERIYHGDED